MRALFVLAILAFAHHAGAWGRLGHEAAARVGQKLLSNDVAARVERILGTNDLASVALWADHLRDAQRNRGPLRIDAEANEFNRRFPENRNWHFVNLPLGTLRYAPTSRFASTNDIVHALNLCVAVLEGRSTQMSKAHALRWLIHLVGDIHQPLHVGCGYYRFKPEGEVVLLREPTEAEGRPTDLGGNLLRFGTNNLHAYWDVRLVEMSAHPESRLSDCVASKRWKTSGPIDRWAAKWAGDAVKEAREAYKGVEFQTAQFNSQGVLTNIAITLPPGYASNQAARVKVQLSKSAFHLAEILNRLKWE
jgi:hypothetical protein